MSAPDPRAEIPKHLNVLRAYALSLTRNGANADDLVQDTIVKAWSNLNKFDPDTNLRAWLFTILRNTFYSDRRRLGREIADSDGSFAARLSEKPTHDSRLQMAEFQRAFENLPDEYREALMLVGVSGLSYEEAASTCDVALGTIKSRVNRARARLAELMEIQGDDPLDLTDKTTKAVLSADNRLQ